MSFDVITCRGASVEYTIHTISKGSHCLYVYTLRMWICRAKDRTVWLNRRVNVGITQLVHRAAAGEFKTHQKCRRAIEYGYNWMLPEVGRFSCSKSITSKVNKMIFNGARGNTRREYRRILLPHCYTYTTFDTIFVCRVEARSSETTDSLSLSLSRSTG